MNTPVAPPRENLQTTAVSTAKKSPAVKSQLVTRIERSVAFKPKATQSSEITKRAISNHLDPLEFAVKEVRCKENDDVIVRCESREYAEKMLHVASASLSEAYVVNLQKPLKPRMKMAPATSECRQFYGRGLLLLADYLWIRV